MGRWVGGWWEGECGDVRGRRRKARGKTNSLNFGRCKGLGQVVVVFINSGPSVHLCVFSVLSTE